MKSDYKGVVVNAPINNLGYGLTGYNIILALQSIGVNVVYYPIGQPESMPQNKTIQECFSKQSNVPMYAPSIKIWHQNDLFSHISVTSRIGFPIFELDTFSPHEVNSLHHCDKIFVCSKWAKEIILKNTNFAPHDVFVIPLGVDTSIFQPKLSSRSPTIFFNCGKWEVRKGHDIIVEVFNSAFNENDDVELWMMCENPFLGENNKIWMDLYKNSRLGSKIRLIPRQPTQRDVYNIMCQSDCGLFPARAEGWNLELLEMMACGKPVITTKYSAHTEFCNSDNAMLVKVDELEPANDGIWFNGQGNWAKIGESQKDQIITHMREVHRLKSMCPTHNEAGVETAKKFSWSNSAREIVNALRHSGFNSSL